MYNTCTTYILTISYALEQEHETIILQPGPHQETLLIDRIEELNEAGRIFSLVRVVEHFRISTLPSGEWQTEITVEEVRPTVLVQKQIIFDPVQKATA